MLDGPYRALPSEAMWPAAEVPFAGWRPDEGREVAGTPCFSSGGGGSSSSLVQRQEEPEDAGVLLFDPRPEGPPDLLRDFWASGLEA